MIAKKLDWRRCGDPVDLDRIRAVERKAGVKLPESLVRVILQCNGGTVEPSRYWYVHPRDGRCAETFGELVTFAEPMDPELRRIYREDPDLWSQMDMQPWSTVDDFIDDPPDHWPRGLLPFADNGSSDFLALDYRDPTPAEPPVVLWLHEEADEPPIFVAASFAALLAMLEPDEEDES